MLLLDFSNLAVALFFSQSPVYIARMVFLVAIIVTVVLKKHNLFRILIQIWLALAVAGSVLIFFGILIKLILNGLRLELNLLRVFIALLNFVVGIYGLFNFNSLEEELESNS